MKKTGTFLSIGFVGLLATLGGLAWDAELHARDPELAHNEGVFTLSNPGHLVFLFGVVMVGIGLTGAIMTTLPPRKVLRVGIASGASLLLLGASIGVALASASGQRTQADNANAAPKDQAQATAAVKAAASAAASHQLPSAQAAGAAMAIEAVDEGTAVKSGTRGTGPLERGTHLHNSIPTRPPTAAELAAADKLIVDTKAGVARYTDLSVAKAAGYWAITPEFLPIVHYISTQCFTKPGVLVPTCPESLIYANTKHGLSLIGAMYVMPQAGMAGPQVGGPLTVWHSHSNLCFSTANSVIVAFTASDGSCPKGSVNRDTPQMLHVWTVDNPDGPFSEDMNPTVLAALS
jgi:hypothetical protein